MFGKCIYFSLNATVRELNRIWDLEYKSVGLTAPQGYLVSLVLKSPGLCQKDIAEQMNLDSSTVTRLLAGLTKKGLIKREEGAKDCRTITVHPTTKSKNLEPKLQAVTHRLVNKLKNLAPEKQIEELTRSSRNFLELLQS